MRSVVSAHARTLHLGPRPAPHAHTTEHRRGHLSATRRRTTRAALLHRALARAARWSAHTRHAVTPPPGPAFRVRARVMCAVTACDTPRNQHQHLAASVHAHHAIVYAVAVCVRPRARPHSQHNTTCVSTVLATSGKGLAAPGYVEGCEWERARVRGVGSQVGSQSATAAQSATPK